MIKMFSIALLVAAGIATVNSCKKADPDPLGNYTCTCFLTVKVDSTHSLLDTVITHEEMIEKSLATTYCANALAANTVTFGRKAVCTLR